MSVFSIPSLIVAQSAETTNSLIQMAPIALMFAVVYFLMIRPQMKKQKEGKKKLKQIGRVEVPQEAFLAALKI